MSRICPIPLLLCCCGVAVAVDADTAAAAKSLAQHFPAEGRVHDGFITHIGISAGLRLFDDEGWKGLEEVVAVNLDWDTTPLAWPIGFALGVHTAWGDVKTADEEDFELRVVDLSAGVRRGEQLGPLELHYGLGVSVGLARLRASAYDDNDASLGGYGQIGLRYHWGKLWYAGIDGRYTYSDKLDLNLATETVSLSGTEVVATFGVRF